MTDASRCCYRLCLKHKFLASNCLQGFQNFEASGLDFRRKKLKTYKRAFVSCNKLLLELRIFYICSCCKQILNSDAQATSDRLNHKPFHSEATQFTFSSRVKFCFRLQLCTDSPCTFIANEFTEKHFHLKKVSYLSCKLGIKRLSLVFIHWPADYLYIFASAATARKMYGQAGWKQKSKIEIYRSNINHVLGSLREASGNGDVRVQAGAMFRSRKKKFGKSFTWFWFHCKSKLFAFWIRCFFCIHICASSSFFRAFGSFKSNSEQTYKSSSIMMNIWCRFKAMGKPFPEKPLRRKCTVIREIFVFLTTNW